MTQTTEPDLGPLTWVKGEIDQALARAAEALGQATSSGEPITHIQFAQTHLHQACGALSIVGLDGLTQFASALERLLGALAHEEQVGSTAEAIAVCQRALASIGNYLEDIVRGAPDQTLRLADLYAALETRRGNSTPNPADLFHPDLTIRAPVRPTGTALDEEAWTLGVRRARAGFERGLLGWLKNPAKPEGASFMRDAARDIQTLQTSHSGSALWWAAQAFFDALAQGGMPANALVRGLCTRYDKELRQQQRGLRTPPESLLRETLYWLAQSGTSGPLQREVCNTWRLEALIPSPGSTVTEVPLAPLLATLQQELVSAKRTWDEFSSGQAAALPRFESHVARLGELGRQLGRPAFERLTGGLSRFVGWLRKDPLRFDDIVGLEAASALLLVEIALDRGVPESDFENQVTDTVARLEALSRGEQLPAADDSATVDAARKLNEKQARAQVAREILGGLAQIEQALDDFFRNPGKRGPLAALAGSLHQIQGALTLVGDERAIDLVKASAHTIAELAAGEDLPPAAHETLAHDLSALGFYVQALQHGPADLLGFLEPESAEEGISCEDAPEPTDPGQALQPQAAFAPDASREPGAASDTPPEMLQTAQPATDTTLPSPPAAATAATLEQTAELDEELLEIFLEEAHEVLDTIAAALLPTTTDADALAVVRRGFHTLKGSGRMVGLSELGEAAWGMEQTLNRWLQLDWPPADSLTRLIEEAHRRFSIWIEQIAARRGLDLDVHELLAEAERLRLIDAPEEGTTDEIPAKTPEPRELAAILAEPVALDLSQRDAGYTGTPAEAPLPVEAGPVAELVAEDAAGMPDSTIDATGSTADEAKPAVGDETLSVAEGDLGAEIVLDDGIWTTGEDPTLRITSLEGISDDFLGAFGTRSDGDASQPGAPAVESTTPSSDADTSSVQTDDATTAFLQEAEPFDFGDLDLELESEPTGQGTPPRGQADRSETPGHADFPIDLSELDIPDDEREPVAGWPTDVTALSAGGILDAGTAPGDPGAEDVSAPEPLIEHEVMPERIDQVARPSAVDDALPPPATTTQSLRIGDVELSSGLYELFRCEAKDHLSSLADECGMLLRNPSRFPDEHAQRAAHTLAGISGTARIGAMHTLARALEHALERLIEQRTAPSAPQTLLLEQSVVTLENMLAEAERRSMPLRITELEEQLDAIGRGTAPAQSAGQPDEATEPEQAMDAVLSDVRQPLTAAAVSDAVDFEPQRISEAPPVSEAAPAADILPEPAAPVHDDLDLQLLPIFIEEGKDLLAQLHTTLREWRGDPTQPESANATARLLHTLKGSARMTGAMRLGEQLHQLESRLETALKAGRETETLLDELESGLDVAAQSVEKLANPEAEGHEPAATRIDGSAIVAEMEAAETGSILAATLRVRADTIDGFVNQAGEIGIARTRIDGELRTLRLSLLDLTENVIRLRNQLREIELQAEMQMQTRIAQAESAHAEFDPLEMDRYTRLQELTRMMAESVGDVTTVQQNLLRNLDGAEMALNSQARMSRELQQALMQVRMVPFDSLADRLYRIVRQSAKELGKRVNLDLRGGRIELDRGVLETITAPLEHLLRNAVAHGIEVPDARIAAGKAPIGQITLTVRQEGNEIAISVSDDGGGLDLERIAEKAKAHGLLGETELSDVRRLTNLIFMPGFTTATNVSAVSGRGVGMDVVKADTASVGGRIDVRSTPGDGTEFRIFLPLTLAATQALLVRIGTVSYAIPSGMIAQVMELKQDALEQVIVDGGVRWQEGFYPYTYLPWLLGDHAIRPEPQRFSWLLLLRAGGQSLAVQVDNLRGNQEVVVKNAGPQIVRIVGITGVTVLGDGEIVLIVNPVALASQHGVRAETEPIAGEIPAVEPVAHQTTVMIVDDSLTVRKITGRLLEREGYRVITAKDGTDALEQLIETVPDVILSDIEMPRMDGFDLLRNLRADERTREVPVIMITSRLADKHREYAMSLGASRYLGKPYDEDELLEIIASLAGTVH